ncbi:hypothetical protein L0Y49_02075 [bacterium]|nr:hypothetical protein [bacterium]
MRSPEGDFGHAESHDAPPPESSLVFEADNTGELIGRLNDEIKEKILSAAVQKYKKQTGNDISLDDLRHESAWPEGFSNIVLDIFVKETGAVETDSNEQS